MRLALLLGCLLFVIPPVWGQAVVVAGVVVDGRGGPMPFVNVQLEGTTEGAATDAEGRFAFATRRQGRQVLRASMIGFEVARQPLDLAPGDTVRARLVLRETLLELGEAVVTASAYATGEAETVALESLDVVTTPGAAADIFLAVKTFPGVAMVDEGAGLFVRGGDVSETVILLDQATLTHPYKFESPTGGVFGTIPPFLVSGTVFSSGGFSARYGNALSAVLAMDSRDLPPQRTVGANLGLAAASAEAHVPIIPGKLGLRFSGNRSFTSLLFRVNGQRENFTTTPRGYDGNLSLIYNYSTTGRLKLFTFLTDDRLGVHVAQPSFEGVYRGASGTRLVNLQWTDVRRGWFVDASASVNRYAAERRLGNLDLEPSDATAKLRTDAERAVGSCLYLRLGAEAERTQNRLQGTIPVLDDVLDPEAEVYQLDENYSATRTGAYAEVEIQAARRLLVGLGLRADHHTLAGEIVADPRLSLRYALAKGVDLRAAWGIYHQFPGPFAFNPESGNPALGAQRAQHAVAGLSYERGLTMLRLEAFHKPYRRLVLRDDELLLANTGDGFARGLDAFARYGGYLRTRFSGWIAYSYLHSCRRQVRDLGETFVLERGPSPFDVTHNLTVVAKARIVGFLSGGLTLRHATGRPLTPVVGAVEQEGGAYFLPIDGPVGSERLPNFQRLDAQLSYFLPFGAAHSAVFYLAAGNLLDRVNLIGYEYARDYASRTPRTSHYRRSIYAGLTVTLNP